MAEFLWTLAVAAAVAFTAGYILSVLLRPEGLRPQRPTTPRYLCHLCDWPRWTPGTYRDAIDHYRTTHREKETP